MPVEKEKSGSLKSGNCLDLPKSFLGKSSNYWKKGL